MADMLLLIYRHGVLSFSLLFEVVVVCYVDSSSVQNFLYHLIYGPSTSCV